jgi:hypothetical protein
MGSGSLGQDFDPEQGPLEPRPVAEGRRRQVAPGERRDGQAEQPPGVEAVGVEAVELGDVALRRLAGAGAVERVALGEVVGQRGLGRVPALAGRRPVRGAPRGGGAVQAYGFDGDDGSGSFVSMRPRR